MQIDAIVAATGQRENGQYGFTFSDLTRRLLPAIVLDAYPDRRVDPDVALNIARDMAPTAPFQDAAS